MADKAISLEPATPQDQQPPPAVEQESSAVRSGGGSLIRFSGLASGIDAEALKEADSVKRLISLYGQDELTPERMLDQMREIYDYAASLHISATNEDVSNLALQVAEAAANYIIADQSQHQAARVILRTNRLRALLRK